MRLGIQIKSKIMLLIITLTLVPMLMAQQKSSGLDSELFQTGPMLFTEKGDFRIGEKVRVTGQQFSPDELITVSVIAADVRTGYKSVVDNWVTYADSKGNISLEWTIPSSQKFLITVTGNESESLVSKAFNSIDGPTVLTYPGNISCSDLNSNNSTFPQITSNWGFKLDFENPNGTFPFVNNGSPKTILLGGAPSDPANSVSTTTTNGGMLLTWSATRPITAVIVKGGNQGSNVYVYNPESMGDAGPLTVPTEQAISYVQFCFQPTAKIVIVKRATPPSNFQFDFSTSGLATTNFSLVDNDPNSDPMRMFTTSILQGTKSVTLTNGGFYTLRNISCVSSNGQSSFNVNLGTMTANITSLAPGDTVTCTFVCDFITAAHVSVGGRVMDPYGRPLSRVFVSVSDANGNTRTVMTNSFGYYRFDELEAGNAYYFNVSHKLYRFSSQLLTLDEDRNDINFVAAPR